MNFLDPLVLPTEEADDASAKPPAAPQLPGGKPPWKPAGQPGSAGIPVWKPAGPLGHAKPFGGLQAAKEAQEAAALLHKNIAPALAVVAEAGLNKKQVGTLEQYTMVLHDSFAAWLGQPISQPQVDAIEAVAEQVAKFRSEAVGKAFNKVHMPASIKAALGVQKVLQEFSAEAESKSRYDVEDLLETYGLSLSKERKLSQVCSYVEINVPKNKKQADLEHFLLDNPSHHLGIFSIETNGKVSCFYVDDLITYFKTSGRKQFSDEDLQGTTAAEWEARKVVVEGVPFSGKNIVSAIEWAAAYAKLKAMLDLLAQNKPMIKAIKDFSDQIVPGKPKGVMPRFLGKMARGVQKKLSSIYDLLAAKLCFDIVSSLACIFVFGYAASSMIASGAVAKSAMVWPAIKTFIIGSVVQKIYSALKTISTGAKATVFGLIMTSATFFLGQIFPEWVTQIFEACVGMIGFLAPKAGLMAAGAAVGALVHLGARAVRRRGAEEPPAPGLAIATRIACAGLYFQVMATLGSAEAAANSIAVAIDVMSPLVDERAGVDQLLKILAAGSVCSITSAALGKEGERVCESTTTFFARIGLKLDLVLSSVDMLVFLVRASWDPLFMQGVYTKTKCETLFADFNVFLV